MEEIQKSIRLINFNDSIFDQTTTTAAEAGEVKEMLKRTDSKKSDVIVNSVNSANSANSANSVDYEVLFMRKFKKIVKFEELVQVYFYETEIDESDDNFWEILKEILVTFRPFLKSKEEFEEILRAEKKKSEGFEVDCYGQIICSAKSKYENLMNYSENIFGSNSVEEFKVICSGKIVDQIDLKGEKFDVKRICEIFSILEALEFGKLNLETFYGSEAEEISKFISIFNKFTNFLISQILSTNCEKERNLIVKRILKLAKEFAEIGAMNSLKSCTSALQASSVHRLNLISKQSSKYRRRFNDLMTLTSPEKNFTVLRERACLIPWLGIILKDFTFIREIGKNSKFINVPLALCLRKLMKSLGLAREACHQFLMLKEDKICHAAVMKSWLESCGILYETESDQYERSLAIQPNL